MAFETERLLIRAWRQEDAPRVLDIRSRLEVVRWLGTPEPVFTTTLDEARDHIRRWNTLEDPPCGYWAIEVKRTTVVAGAVLLLPLPQGDGEVEIGWHLHPDSQGQGFATEAAAAVLRRGFAGGLGEILALTDLDNEPSKSVCARLGMTPMGRVRKWYDVESLLFGLTADAFAATPAAEGLAAWTAPSTGRVTDAFHRGLSGRRSSRPRDASPTGPGSA